MAAHSSILSLSNAEKIPKTLSIAKAQGVLRKFPAMSMGLGMLTPKTWRIHKASTAANIEQ